MSTGLLTQGDFARVRKPRSEISFTRLSRAPQVVRGLAQCLGPELNAFACASRAAP